MEPGCPHGSERLLGKDSPFVPSQLRNQHSQPVARERHPVPSPAGTLGRAGGMGNPAAQLVLCTIKSGREQVYLCSVFFFPISQAKLALFLGAVGFVLFSSPPAPCFGRAFTLTAPSGRAAAAKAAISASLLSTRAVMIPIPPHFGFTD